MCIYISYPKLLWKFAAVLLYGFVNLSLFNRQEQIAKLLVNSFMFPLNISTGLNPDNSISFYIYYWDCLLSLLRTCLKPTNSVFKIIKGEVDSKVFAHPQCTCLLYTIVAVNGIKIEERLAQRGVMTIRVSQENLRRESSFITLEVAGWMRSIFAGANQSSSDETMNCS